MGRDAEFANAARAQTLAAYTPTRGYRMTSVYDSIMPSPNGYGLRDRQRLLPGNNLLRSVNGISPTSYQLSLWLR